VTFYASNRNIQLAQNNLRSTFNSLEINNVNDTLQTFENPTAPSAIKNAWDPVKELSGKRTRSVVFIEGED